MYLVSFYIDGAERTCRAKVLACSASDAPFYIHYRDTEFASVLEFSFSFQRNH